MSASANQNVSKEQKLQPTVGFTSSATLILKQLPHTIPKDAKNSDTIDSDDDNEMATIGLHAELEDLATRVDVLSKEARSNDAKFYSQNRNAPILPLFIFYLDGTVKLALILKTLEYHLNKLNESYSLLRNNSNHPNVNMISESIGSFKQKIEYSKNHIISRMKTYTAKCAMLSPTLWQELDTKFLEREDLKVWYLPWAEVYIAKQEFTKAIINKANNNLEEFLHPSSEGNDSVRPSILY